MSKRPSIVTATVRTPKPAKPRKRPRQWGVTWYDVELTMWRVAAFSTVKADCEVIVSNLRGGHHDADPATVRIVEIPGE